MKKRIICLLVALAMVLGNVPAYVAGAHEHVHAHAEENSCSSHEAFCTAPDTCINCGLTEADGISIDAITHWNTEWVLSPEGHMSVCTDCGNELGGMQTHRATCPSNGVCSTCGMTEAEGAVISVTHGELTNAWDDERHWTVCSVCQAEVTSGEHYVSCKNPGVCLDCGKSCSVPEEEWQHNLSVENLGYDATNCWYECLDCGAGKNYEEHWATCQTPNICDRCGLDASVYGVEFRVSHQDGIDWANPAKTSTYHYWECVYCGEMSESPHGATCVAEDTCAGCGMTVAEGAVMEWVGHIIDWDTPVKTSETHAYVCTECGYEEANAHHATCTNEDTCAGCGMTVAEGAVMEGVDHEVDWDNPAKTSTHHIWECTNCGKVIEDPHVAICAAADTCEGCGMTVAEGAVIEWVNHEIDWEAPVKTSESHGFACKVCDYEEVSSHYAACTNEDACASCGMTKAEGAAIEWVDHDFDWDNIPATETHHTLACSACGYEEVGTHWTFCSNGQTCETCGASGVVIDHVEHELDWENWMYDEYYHWFACGNCGEKVEMYTHHGTCMDPDTCQECGATAADGAVMEWSSHQVDYDNMSFDAERHWATCQLCGETVEDDYHWAICADPDTCLVCGQTGVSINGSLSHMIEIGKSSENGHEIVCVDCGMMYMEDHWADCKTPGVCGSCGWESADMDFNHHVDYENPAGYDEDEHWFTCRYCGVETERGTHIALCSDPDTCAVCGKSDVNIPDCVHYENIHSDETGHYFKCSGCGYESEKEPHFALCNDPDFCLYCNKIVTGNIVVVHDEVAHIEADVHYFVCKLCGFESEKEEHMAECTDPDVCSYCGYEGDMAVVHPELEVVKEAPVSCEEDGVISLACASCEKAWDEVLEKATGHDYEVTKDVVATCEEDGVHEETCKNCGDVVVTREKATGHDYEVTKDVPATEIEAGVHEETCKNCGKVVVTELPSTGCTHEWELVSRTEPTCTENGKVVEQCASCGETNTRVLSELGHAFGLYVSQGTGVHQAACANCGVTKDKNCEFVAANIGGLDCEICSVCGYIRYALLPVTPVEGEETAEGEEQTEVVKPVQAVVVEAVAENAVPENAVLTVYNQTALLPEEATVKAIFTVGVSRDGESLQLEGAVKVQIDWEELTGEAVEEWTEEKVAEVLKGYRLVLINADGTMTEVEIEIVDGKLVFETGLVGTFALVPVEE